MRRSDRQELKTGWEYDWVALHWRRLLGYVHRPGFGKWVKRQMARRRRREGLPAD
jgi:hypothetical protein